MPTISPTLPTIGDLNLTEDPDVRNALLTIVNAINGQLDKDNLLDAGITTDKLVASALQALGLNSTGVVRRGKSIIAGTDSRTNTAYGLMAVPDRVSGVVVPADATVLLSYSAQWQDTVAAAARAAFFIGANQLKVPTNLAGANAPVTEAATPSASDTLGWQPLISAPWGLGSAGAGGDWLSEVSTGQALALPSTTLGTELSGNTTGLTASAGYGGLCVVENLAAGTYDFSVQFKASSGSVSVRQRHLKVLVLGF